MQGVQILVDAISKLPASDTVRARQRVARTYANY